MLLLCPKENIQLILNLEKMSISTKDKYRIRDYKKLCQRILILFVLLQAQTCRHFHSYTDLVERGTTSNQHIELTESRTLSRSFIVLTVAHQIKKQTYNAQYIF